MRGYLRAPVVRFRRLFTGVVTCLAAGLLVLTGPGFAGAAVQGHGRAASAPGGGQARAAASHRAGPAPPSRPRPRRSAPLLTGAPKIKATAAGVSYAHTYTVDTTTDLPWTPGACASGNPGTCSLRAAVTQANDDGTLDRIVVPADTYLLETDELAITDTAGVWIDGAGASTTTVEADSTSPAYPFRVFQLTGGAQAAMSGLTISDGSSSTSSAAPTTEDGYGGGIEVLDGTLDLTTSLVTGDQSEYDGAGIYVAGQGSVSGGVQSQAYLNSLTISGDTADRNGGGLDDEGQAQATDVTVTGNAATSTAAHGGGIEMTDTGSYGPSLDGNGLTITGNTSDNEGGGIFDNGTLDLTGATIGTKAAPNTATDNGGGLYVGYLATLTRVTVAYNTAGTDGAGIDNEYQLTMTGGSIGHNGPASMSDDIDGGGLYSDYDTALSKVTVSGNSGYDGGGIYLNEDALTVNGGSVTGNSAYDGGGIYSPETASTGGAITLTGVPVGGNHATDDGGGIYEGCCGLALTGGSIDGNTAASQGGGLWNFYPAHLTSTTLAGNSAPDGGGIYDSDGDLTLSHVTVGTHAKPNTAEEGGGIYAYESDETISDSTITGNKARDSGAGEGGGIFTSEEEMDLIGSTVAGNSSDFAGGGIYNGPKANNEGGDLDITGSTISSNTAAASGGGIDNEYGLTMTNDTVALNQAGATHTPGSGGGIYNDSAANATLTNVTLSGNTALDGGAGGGVGNLGTFHLKGTILAGNTGGSGEANCGGSAAVSSSGYNLESDTSCALSGPGDLNDANPHLGPLRRNGGPTETEAIPVTSPAVDADSSCPPPATDQRGVKRGKPCDIGAYENTHK